MLEETLTKLEMADLTFLKVRGLSMVIKSNEGVPFLHFRFEKLGVNLSLFSFMYFVPPNLR